LLSVADDYDIRVMIHTDRSTSRASSEEPSCMQWPPAHAFQTEGAGGGPMRPDIIKVSCSDNVPGPALHHPNPAFHPHTIDAHLDMLDGVPSSRPSFADDLSFAESRIPKRRSRRRPPADLGAPLDVFGLAGHGPARQVISRTWQTPTDEEAARTAAGNETVDNDNVRVKRYGANRTSTRRSRTACRITSFIEKGRSPTWCCWSPSFFGSSPHYHQGGSIVGGSEWVIPTPRFSTRILVLIGRVFVAFGPRLSRRRRWVFARSGGQGQSRQNLASPSSSWP